MKKAELQTPAILVDLDIMEKNLRKYQELCNQNGKELWPMVKTHKSTELAKMQAEIGAKGFLCGTLEECEGLCDAGFKNIMYAYPVASSVNIGRVIALAKKCNFIIRLDDVDGAKLINQAAEEAGVKINYTIIVDSGLNRFGVPPEKVVDFANSLKELKGLVFKGISTHPGHVYSAQGPEDIPKYIEDEKTALKKAADSLRGAGYSLEIVSSGATPTFFGAVTDENINIFHPGNYVFNDYIQMSTDIAKESECALTVLTTVVSHPSEDHYMCDAGSKTFGLDKGAHGNTSIKGYGYVKGYPELTVSSLSEEVGKLHVEGSTNLKVGDKLEIIPNHACSSANLTTYLIGCRGDKVERLIEIDMRGNSTTKNAK